MITILVIRLAQYQPHFRLLIKLFLNIPKPCYIEPRKQEHSLYLSKFIRANKVAASGGEGREGVGRGDGQRRAQLENQGSMVSTLAERNWKE